MAKSKTERQLAKKDRQRFDCETAEFFENLLAEREGLRERCRELLALARANGIDDPVVVEHTHTVTTYVVAMRPGALGRKTAWVEEWFRALFADRAGRSRLTRMLDRVKDRVPV